MAEEKTPRVHVKASPASGERVALWDVDPRHPDGEIYVAGQEQEPVEAAETDAVLAAISDGRLLRVEGGSAAARAAAKEGQSAANEPPAGPAAGGVAPVAETRRR